MKKLKISRRKFLKNASVSLLGAGLLERNYHAMAREDKGKSSLLKRKYTMTERKLSKPAYEILKNMGYNDDQIKTIESNPKQLEVAEAIPLLITKKIVATCIETENCGLNKVGDKYVYNASGYMMKDETCERPCLWAMSIFLKFSYMIFDRAASGLDPNGMHFEYISCPDTGCSYGGFGKAMFKLSVEDL